MLDTKGYIFQNIYIALLNNFAYRKIARIMLRTCDYQHSPVVEILTHSPVLQSFLVAHTPTSVIARKLSMTYISQGKRADLPDWTECSINHSGRNAPIVTKKLASIYIKVRRHTFPSPSGT